MKESRNFQDLTVNFKFIFQNFSKNFSKKFDPRVKNSLNKLLIAKLCE